MLKRMLAATICSITLLGGAATIPTFAQEQSSQPTQNDNKMSDSKKKDDRMAGDQMSGDNMSGKKKGKHRKHGKDKPSDSTQSNTNQ